MIMGFNVVFLIYNLLAFVGLPLLLAGILTWFGEFNKQFLVDDFGVNSQNILGGLGVVIHELSHYSIAKLFFDPITDVCLLNLHRPEQSKSLGYVDFRDNPHSLFSGLGNFFIGIAPCFGCSLTLWLIHLIFWRDGQFQMSGVTNFSTLFSAVGNNLIHPLGQFGWKWIVFILLILMISSTGYGLSKQDWYVTLVGLPYWSLLIVIFDVIAQYTGLGVPTTHLIFSASTLWLTFLGWGIVYSFITLIILYMISLVKRI